MAVVRETPRWDRLFAKRTRGDVGEGIAAVLGFLGRPDLISFAGGFPDPLTFPRERASALLEEFAATGEATAFQYAPTRGLDGPLEAIAGRLDSLQGRRLPRARLRRRSRAESLEPCARRRRAGGHDVEDVVSRRAARLGGRPGRGVGAARLGEAEHRPVRRCARTAALRGVRAPRLDR